MKNYQKLHNEEIQVLNLQLKDVQEKLKNIEKSYEDYIQNLHKRINNLEAIQEKSSSALFEQAKQALIDGDIDLAKKYFEAFDEEEDKTFIAIAESKFQQAIIADESYRYDDAFKLYSRAIDLNPDNVEYLNAIALLYQKRANPNKAVECFEKGIKLSINQNGENTRESMALTNNLAHAYYYLEKFDDALENFKKALNMLDIIDDGRPLDTCHMMSGMGDVYAKKNDFPRAIDCYKKVYLIHEKHYGSSNPTIANDLNSLGKCQGAQKNYQGALNLFDKAHAINIACLGEGHPNLVEGYCGMARVFLSCNNPAQAKIHLKDALKISLRFLDEKHPDIANIYSDLGECCGLQKKYDEAIEYANKSLKINLEFFANDYVEVIRNYTFLAQYNGLKKDYINAKKYAEIVVEIKLTKFGKNHESLMGDYTKIAFSLYHMEEYSRAINNYNLALLCDYDENDEDCQKLIKIVNKKIKECKERSDE